MRQVEKPDRRIVARQADVRDAGGLTAATDDGVAELGRLDALLADAGIVTFGTETHAVPERAWQDLIDDVSGVSGTQLSVDTGAAIR